MRVNHSSNLHAYILWVSGKWENGDMCKKTSTNHTHIKRPLILSFCIFIWKIFGIFFARWQFTQFLRIFRIIIGHKLWSVNFHKYIWNLGKTNGYLEFEARNPPVGLLPPRCAAEAGPAAGCGGGGGTGAPLVAGLWANLWDTGKKHNRNHPDLLKSTFSVGNDFGGGVTISVDPLTTSKWGNTGKYR